MFSIVLRPLKLLNLSLDYKIFNPQNKLALPDKASLFCIKVYIYLQNKIKHIFIYLKLVLIF